MALDLLATEPQFADHLAPIWHALPEAARGDFIAHRALVRHCAKRGLPLARGPNDARRPVLVASYGDVKHARAMGRTRIAFIEHGIGQSYGGDAADQRAARHGSYAGGRDRADVSLFLVPNAHSAARWQTAYPDARVEAIGCPKLDGMPSLDPTGEPGVVAVSFHWDAMLCQETRSTFTYYRDVLPALKARFHLIGHGHPRGIDSFEPRLRRAYRRLEIELVEDFEDVCRRAALYVCDNSSSMFEFAATGRPVVVLNEPVRKQANRGYRRGIDHGLRFWEASSVGLNVWAPEDLCDVVDAALADPPEVRAAREAALDLVYAYRSGAAERAAAALVSWLAEAQEEAA